MTQKRYQEVVNGKKKSFTRLRFELSTLGWKKQNSELEAEIQTYRNQKETNKETLAQGDIQNRPKNFFFN